MRPHTPESGYIVQDEFEMNLRLLGAQTIKDLIPDMVDASNIHSHLVTVPRDQLYETNCTPLCFPTHSRAYFVLQMRVCNTHLLEDRKSVV